MAALARLVRPYLRLRLTLALLGPVLAGCGGSGGPRGQETPPVKVSVLASPRTVEITAGQSMLLSAVVAGSTNQKTLWSVRQPDGGRVTPRGIYTAPDRIGAFQVDVEAEADPSAKDVIRVNVHPRPQALELKAEPARIVRGGRSTLTARFAGGTAVLLPGSRALEDGASLEVQPEETTDYTLRVTNTLGVTDEIRAHVVVDPVDGTIRKHIHAPESLRQGNTYVAWSDGRAGASLRWSSKDVVFLGQRAEPSSHVVVFTPRPEATSFELELRIQGGETPGGPVTQEEVFHARGSVVAATGLEPDIRLSGPFLSADKTGHVARVANAVPGAVYAWSARNGEIEGHPTGPEATFRTLKADYLLLTCHVRLPGGGDSSTTTGAMLVPVPDPPRILVPPADPALPDSAGWIAAGIPQWAYVGSRTEGLDFHWNLSPDSGAFEGGSQGLSGIRAGFTIRKPGTFTLSCTAENLAGDRSAPATLVLNAVGPMTLPPPRIQVASLVRANGGPFSAEVEDANKALHYTWTIQHGRLEGEQGAQVWFHAQEEPLVLLTCTAKDPVTGATSTATVPVPTVAAPSVPEISAPVSVLAGVRSPAVLLHGGRPGETYEWTIAPTGSILGHGVGATAAFTPGHPAGTFVLACVAVNRIGDRSAPGRFSGTVVSPDLALGTMAGGTAQGPAGQGGSVGGVDPAREPVLSPLPTSVVQPGASAHPDPVVQPGASAHPDPVIQPGASAHPDPVVQPGASAHPDPVIQPGASAHPDPGGQPGASAQPNPLVHPAGSSLSGAGSHSGPSPDPGVSGTSSGVDPTLTGGGSGTASALLYPAFAFIINQPVNPPLTPVVRNLSGPFIFEILAGGLPEGLNLDRDSGEIQGTPTRMGPFVVKVGARPLAGGSPVEALLTGLVEQEGTLTLTYPPPPATLEARSLMARLTPVLTRATPNAFTRFQVVGGSLPAGITFGPDGSLEGAPKGPGTFRATIQAENWTRRATADVMFTVLPCSAPLSLFYPDRLLDTLEMPSEEPLLRFEVPGAPRGFSLASGSALPPNFELDRDTGVISLPPTASAVAGTYRFRVEVDFPADGEHAVSPEITYTILDFTPPKVLAFGLSNPAHAVLEAPGLATFTWTLEGRIKTLDLQRDLFPIYRGGARTLVPERDALISLPADATSADLPVKRRQRFSLVATDLHDNKAMSQEVQVAAKGMEVVAGQTDGSFPAAEYGSGDGQTGRLRNLTGMASAGGVLFLAEGPDHTVRLAVPALGGGLELKPFLGILAGPDENLPLVGPSRFNDPGPMAVVELPGGHAGLVISDRGTRTLKLMDLSQATPAVSILAGTIGGTGAPASSFGEITDVAAAGPLVFVADRLHGIRMVDVRTGAMKDLAYHSATFQVGSPSYRLPPITHPVGIAVGGSPFRLFVTTEFLPDWRSTGKRNLPNGMIQILTPDVSGTPVTRAEDLWDAAWTLKPLNYAESAGMADGGRDSKFKNPIGMVMDGNRLLVADRGNHLIRAVVWAGGEPVVSTFAGRIQGLNDSSRMPGEALFKRPTRIVSGGAPGCFWVADQDEHVLRRLVEKTPVMTEPKARQVESRTLFRPKALVRPDEDRAANSVNPKAGAQWETADPGRLARFVEPVGIVVDGLHGDAFVAEEGAHVIRRVILRRHAERHIPSGFVATFAGTLSKAGPASVTPVLKASAQFTHPIQVAMDGLTRLYVLDNRGEAIRIIDQGKVSPFLDLGPVPPGHTPLLAVRNGRLGPQLLVLARWDAATDVWEVSTLSVPEVYRAAAPKVPVPLAQLPPGVRPQALAVGLDDRIYVLVEDRITQRAWIRTYVPTGSGGSGPAAWTRVAVPTPTSGEPFTPWCFGPGAPGGEGIGFPEVRGMTVDTKGNLFLSDRANGVIWMAAHDTGQVACIAGRFGEQRPLGDRDAVPFSEPLLALGGIAVTPDDDVVVVSGDAIVQLTAPGSAAAPWTPALGPIPRKGQVSHASLGGVSSTSDEEGKETKKPAGPARIDVGAIAAGRYEQAEKQRLRHDYESAFNNYGRYLQDQPDGAFADLARTARLEVCLLAAEAAASDGQNVKARTLFQAFLGLVPPADSRKAGVETRLAGLPAHDAPKPSSGTGALTPGGRTSTSRTASGRTAKRPEPPNVLQMAILAKAKKAKDPTEAMGFLRKFLDVVGESSERDEAQRMLMDRLLQEGRRIQDTQTAKAKGLYQEFLSLAPGDHGDRAAVEAWVAAH